MSHTHTRKSFLGRLLTALAVGGAAPRMFAHASPVAPAPARDAVTSPAVQVRPEARAVARGADTV